MAGITQPAGGCAWSMSAVEAQCAIAVAGDDDVAVALHDLLSDRHALHAVVAAYFAARQRLPGEDGIEGFVGAAVGVHLRLCRAFVGPAEAAHHHRPATEAGLQAGFSPVRGNDHHRGVLHLPWQVPNRVWHSAGVPASACCGGRAGVIDCALRLHSTKDGAMSMILRGLLALACAGAVCMATAAVPAGPQIVTDDVSRFYALYDNAGGKPSVAQLRGYMAEGSAGLAELAKTRRVTPERIAESIANQPELYAQGRSCLAELPAVKQRLTQVFSNLQAIYPQAAFPPVTIAVGRGRPVGLTSKSGVIIGLEALCAADFMNPNVQDRFVHVIAHEYVHIQQTGLTDFEPGDPHATVLRVSLGEGIAEFIAELISGNVGNGRHAAWTRGREVHIESAFAVAVQLQARLAGTLRPGVLGGIPHRQGLLPAGQGQA
jgi:hypothetical protein